MIVVGVLALLAGGLMAIRYQQQGRIRRSVLETAHTLAESGQAGLAIRHLENYLMTKPDDPAILELLAKVRADSVVTPEDMAAAAKINDHLCRIDPDGKDRQESRRRVAELYIRYSEILSSSLYARVAPVLAVQDYRYRAAETVAREMVARDPRSSVAHRLLARALEGIAGPSDDELIAKAADEYAAALALDPKDIEAAERLAKIDDERRKDPEAANEVLNRLLKALPKSPEVRLARYFRYFRTDRQELAAFELEEALKLAPNAPVVRLTAADYAISRNNPTEARRHLDALPKSRQLEPRVRLIRGQADFLDDRPDEAIAEWRTRLMNSGGTDSIMTWNLAMNLIRAGRVSEAKPLVDQYRRLIGEDNRPELDLLRALLDEKSGSSSRALVALDRLKDKVDLTYIPEVELAIGRCHLALRDEAGAEAAFRRAVKANPKASQPRRELARLIQRRQPLEEVAELRRGLAMAPNDPDLRLGLADALVRQQARVSPDRRNWSETDAAITSAAAVFVPGNYRIVRLQARRRELSNPSDVAGALALLEGAVTRNNDSPVLWVDWARTLERAGRRAEAIAVLDKAPIDRPLIRITKAGMLVNSGQRREARASLENGIEKLPADFQQALWKALGDLLVDLGEREEAKAAYDRWIRATPADDPRPRIFMMGRSLQDKDFTAAQAYLEILQDLIGRDDSLVRLARAEMLLRSSSDSRDSDSRPGEALRLLDAVLTMTPSLPEAHMLRAEALTRRGRVDDAIVACRRARDLGLSAATPLLVTLMTSRRRFDDLDRLPRTANGPDLDRLAAEAALTVNEPSWASRFVDRVAESGDDSPETLAWRARMYERMGRLDEADNILYALAERRPTELGPWLDLVHVQAMRGKYATIATTIEKAKSQVKSDSPEMVEARCLWARGDRKAAERAFAVVLQKHPDDVPALMLASGFLWTTGRLDLADQGYRRVLAIDPENRDAKRGLAIVLSRSSSSPENWEKAWATLNSGQSGPRSETLSDRVARAILLARAPDLVRRTQAIDLLQGLRLDVPDSTIEAAMVRESLVRLLLETGQADRACQIAAVPESRSNDALAIAFWAEILIQAGRKDEAIKQLDWLTKLAPGDTQEATLRARILWDPAKPAEGAARLERAYLDRGNSPGASALGRVAFNLLATAKIDAVAERLGRQMAAREPGLSWMPAKILGRHYKYEEALDFCRIALEAGNNSDMIEAVRVAQAIAFSDTTQVPAVAALTEAGRKRDPDQIEIRLAEAGLQHLKGDYPAEVRSYRELLAGRQDDVLLLNNLAWSLSEGMKNPEEALGVIDKVIKIQGRIPSALDTRGVILTRLKRYPEAITDLETAVGSEPRPSRYYHLARAYQLAGQPEKFKKNREAALRSGLQVDQIDPCERVECASLMKP